MIPNTNFTTEGDIFKANFDDTGCHKIQSLHTPGEIGTCNWGMLLSLHEPDKQVDLCKF